MKQLEKCKDCEYYSPKCPLYVEDVHDVDDGAQKFTASKDVLVHVPGCGYEDCDTAFEIMDECPMDIN